MKTSANATKTSITGHALSLLPCAEGLTAADLDE
jgi:hypothetical protein